MCKIRASDKPFIAVNLATIFDLQDKTYTLHQASDKAKNMLSKWERKYPFLTDQLSITNLRCYLTILNFDFKVRCMLYATNWFERLNKTFRQALKISNAMPSVDSVLLLLSAIACDSNQKVYSYRNTYAKKRT